MMMRWQFGALGALRQIHNDPLDRCCCAAMAQQRSLGLEARDLGLSGGDDKIQTRAPSGDVGSNDAMLGLITSWCGRAAGRGW